MADFDDVYSENPSSAYLTVGGGGRSGKLFLKAMVEDTSRREPEMISATIVSVDAGSATLKLGEPHVGSFGIIDMFRVEIDADEALIRAGGNSGRGEGRLELKNRLGKNAVQMDAGTGKVMIGEERTNGQLYLKNDNGDQTAHINGEHGNLTLGGPGADGDITIRSSANVDTFSINGDSALVKAGGENTNGRFQLRNASGTVTADLIGEHGNLVLGGSGADGDITLRSSANEDVIRMDGNDAKIIVGGVGANGDIIMRNNRDVDTIRITGSNGDIEFMNADFAEEFTVDDTVLEIATPGTVMVLADSGKLVPCDGRYDSRVIGVIAGAGQYKPALLLDRQGGKDRMPVAMVGKVMCRVTAANGAIKMGDLLTTADLPGHAMRVDDRSRALGAVIGKALAPLDEGTAVIPVLVNLQ